MTSVLYDEGSRALICNRSWLRHAGPSGQLHYFANRDADAWDAAFALFAQERPKASEVLFVYFDDYGGVSPPAIPLQSPRLENVRDIAVHSCIYLYVAVHTRV